VQTTPGTPGHLPVWFSQFKCMNQPAELGAILTAFRLTSEGFRRFESYCAHNFRILDSACRSAKPRSRRYTLSCGGIRHWLASLVAVLVAGVACGRIETRTLRVLPIPEGADFPGVEQAVLIERYVTVKKNGTWVMRNCEAVLYITSLAAADASPEDLHAHVRGHWTVEHLQWLRDVVWHEDKSLIRTRNAPQVMSALANLVITAFRIQGVTRYAEETRRNAQNPHPK
jgi:hypothetical protein